MLSLTVNEHLMLRTYIEDDAAEHFLLVDKNRKHLRPWLRWIDGYTKAAHSLEYIRYTHNQQDTQQGLMLAIFENGKLIGDIAMHKWEHDLKKAEIGYWIDEDHQGQGILQKCLTKFFDYIFNSLDMNKLEVRFVPSNKKSGKLAERMGFKTEGILRDSYFINGKFEDLVVGGLLKKEWKR